MKSLFSLIFLFLFANSAFATNLCDTSCNLTISFPTGGSIEATEALAFTFGVGGVLDLGATGTINTAVQPASTDFSAGGSLSLAVGESITFDAGGSLNLGTGGGIDYTSITVTTDGVFDLQIDSVADTFYVGDIAIIGTGTLTISLTGSNLETGSLSTGGDLIITSTGSIDAVGVIVVSGLATFNAGSRITVTNVGNDFQGSVSLTSIGDISLVDSDSIALGDISAGVGNLTITALGGIVADSGSVTGSCTTSSDGSLTISTASYPTISTCNTITVDGSITVSSPNTLNTIDIATFSGDGVLMTEWTIDGVLYQIDQQLVDGEVVMYATGSDGTTGTLEFKDGAFVFIPDAKGGAVGLLAMFSLLIVPMVLRRQKRYLCIR